MKPSEGQPLLKEVLWPRWKPPCQQKLCIAPGENRARDGKRLPSYSGTSSLYPELAKGPILSPDRTHSSLNYQPTAPTVLPLREVPDGNQGAIRVHVPFLMSDLSKAEDKLGSFTEDPELFKRGLHD